METKTSRLHFLRSPLQRGFAMIYASYVMALMGGCTAEVETAHPVAVADDADLVEAETIPADVYAAPRVDYRGHLVYYTNGHWYYPRGRRWYYYRNEPPELVRHRRYIETAPPARPSNNGPGPGDAVRVR